MIESMIERPVGEERNSEFRIQKTEVREDSSQN